MRSAALPIEGSYLSGYEAFATANITRSTWTAYRVWGLVNLLFLVSSLITPPLGRLGTIYSQTVIFSVVLWILFAGTALRLWLTVPWPVRLIALFQIWSCICVFYADNRYGIGTMEEGIGTLGLTYLSLFAVGAIAAQIDPSSRVWFKRAFIAAALLSAVFSLLQFAGVGAARRLVGIYQSGQPLTGENYFRSVGLFSYASWSIFLYTTAGVLLASPVVYRKLTVWETLGAFLLLCCGVLPQQRTFYAMIILAGFVLSIVFLFRMRSKATGYVIGLAVLSVIAGPIVVPRLGYALQSGKKSRESLLFRQDFSWPQAYRAMREEPFFGKGPNSQYLTVPEVTIHTKHFSGKIIDNGYFTASAMYGFPGLVLMVGTFLLGILSATRMALDTKISGERRAFAMTVACVLAGAIFVMPTATIFTIPNMMGPLLMMSGLAVSTTRERAEEYIGARRRPRVEAA